MKKTKFLYVIVLLAVLALIPVLTAMAAPVATFPKLISLPDGFRPEGIFKEYYGSGQLKGSRNYLNGLLGGLYKEYYESGVLKGEWNYKDGKKDKIVGDILFEEAINVAGAITPVPGGVGPVTIAYLLKNTLEAAKIASS